VGADGDGDDDAGVGVVLGMPSAAMPAVGVTRVLLPHAPRTLSACTAWPWAVRVSAHMTAVVGRMTEAADRGASPLGRGPG